MIAEVEQTVHPLAKRTLSRLQELANEANEKGKVLYRDDYTPFEWQCIVDITLTIKRKPSLNDISDAKNFRSTAEI